MKNSTNYNANFAAIASLGGEIPIDFKHGYKLRIFGKDAEDESVFTIILETCRSEPITLCVKGNTAFFVVSIKENGMAFPGNEDYVNEDDYVVANINHLNWCNNVETIKALLEASSFSHWDSPDATPFENMYYFQKGGVEKTISNLIGAICTLMEKDAGKTKIFSTEKYPWEEEF